MNLYPKKINLYQFTPNSCQFMLIYRRFFITYIAHAPQVDIPTPIIDPNTRICPLKSEKTWKTPNFPQFLKFHFSGMLIYVNL